MRESAGGNAAEGTGCDFRAIPVTVKRTKGQVATIAKMGRRPSRMKLSRETCLRMEYFWG